MNQRLKKAQLWLLSASILVLLGWVIVACYTYANSHDNIWGMHTEFPRAMKTPRIILPDSLSGLVIISPGHMDPEPNDSSPETLAYRRLIRASRGLDADGLPAIIEKANRHLGAGEEPCKIRWDSSMPTLRVRHEQVQSAFIARELNSCSELLENVHSQAR